MTCCSCTMDVSTSPSSLWSVAWIKINVPVAQQRHVGSIPSHKKTIIETTSCVVSKWKSHAMDAKQDTYCNRSKWFFWKFICPGEEQIILVNLSRSLFLGFVLPMNCRVTMAKSLLHPKIYLNINILHSGTNSEFPAKATVGYCHVKNIPFKLFLQHYHTSATTQYIQNLVKYS